jgi:hypothetical protein
VQPQAKVNVKPYPSLTLTQEAILYCILTRSFYRETEQWDCLSLLSNGVEQLVSSLHLFT